MTVFEPSQRSRHQAAFFLPKIFLHHCTGSSKMFYQKFPAERLKSDSNHNLQD